MYLLLLNARVATWGGSEEREERERKRKKCHD